MSQQTLVKHAAAIMIANTLTLTERKLWNVLLHRAYPFLMVRAVHRIPAADLYAVSTSRTENTQWLRQSFLALMDRKLEWDALNTSAKRWEGCVALSHAAIEDGECRYGYPEPLRQGLHTPPHYARLDLEVQKRFTRTASLVLWEYFHLEMGANPTAAVHVPLDELRTLLGFQRGEYEDFKELRRSVLTPAIEDVNSNADMVIGVEYTKRGRQVAGIHFTCERRIKEDPLVARMRDEFGLSQKAIDVALARFPDRAGLLQLLGYVKDMYDAGKVKSNLGGYAAVVLANGNPATLKVSPKQLPSSKALPEVLNPEKERELARHAFETHVWELANTRFTGWPEEQQKRFEVDHIYEVLEGPLKKRYEEHGLTSRMVRGVFIGTFAKLILEGDYPDFQQWFEARKGVHSIAATGGGKLSG